MTWVKYPIFHTTVENIYKFKQLKVTDELDNSRNLYRVCVTFQRRSEEYGTYTRSSETRLRSS